jgi:hypothetical protein
VKKLESQNLLIEFKEKWLQWFGRLKRIDRTRTPRMALEFKGRRPMG